MSTADNARRPGDVVFREALELLDGLSFDTVRGGVARSTNVFISVIPELEDGNGGRFRATVICRALWHQDVDWSRLRVTVRPQEPAGFFVQHMLAATAGGHARFGSLERGRYVLRGYCRLTEFTAPEKDASESTEDSAMELAAGVAMDGSLTSENDDELLTKSDIGPDGVCVLIHRRGNRVLVAFASNSDALASRTIGFHVSDPNTHEVLLDEQTAVFEPSVNDAEFRYKTDATALSFAAGVAVEVAYRVR